MTQSRSVLIVNADDFGQSTGINQGIIQCFEQGLVTSASLMVCGAFAPSAADYSRAHPELSIGLHLDLGEWFYSDNHWHTLYQRVDVADKGAVHREAHNQLVRFRQLLGRDPTHLDSHQHIHREEPLRTIAHDMAQQLNIPLRHFSSQVQFCGRFYGQSGKGEPYAAPISINGLQQLIKALPDGITEIGCHPSATIDFVSMYSQERLQETKTLCDVRGREIISQSGINLTSFHMVNGRHSDCRVYQEKTSIGR